MRKTYLAAAASLGALMLASTPASAAITIGLNDVKFDLGGTLTGTFTTTDDLSDLLDFSFTTSADDYGWFFGNFPGATYTKADAHDWSILWNPSGFITGLSASFGELFGNPAFSTISLVFDGNLSDSGTTPLLLSNETVLTWDGGTRFSHISSGSVSPVAGAIPEPGTWALMIGGLALVGASMRRRKVAVSFA
jgi:hypothetical protein